MKTLSAVLFAIFLCVPLVARAADTGFGSLTPQEVFAKLKQKHTTTPLEMSADESDLLKLYQQISTPFILPVQCAGRSEEAYIVGIRGRKPRGKTDLLQFRPQQKMTPEQKAEFDTWDAEKQATYSERLTEEDCTSNEQFINRHRNCNKVPFCHTSLRDQMTVSDRSMSHRAYVLCYALALQVVSAASVTPSAASSSVVQNSFDQVSGEAEDGSKKRKEPTVSLSSAEAKGE